MKGQRKRTDLSMKGMKGIVTEGQGDRKKGMIGGVLIEVTIEIAGTEKVIGNVDIKIFVMFNGSCNLLYKSNKQNVIF